MQKQMRIVTHSGGFHADDAFAVAALLLYREKTAGIAEVVRTRDPAVIAGGDFVVDVGGEYDEARNRFDHHQPGGAGVRPNGVPYASFGLVWKKFGAALSGSVAIAERIDARIEIARRHEALKRLSNRGLDGHVPVSIGCRRAAVPASRDCPLQSDTRPVLRHLPQPAPQDRGLDARCR